MYAVPRGRVGLCEVMDGQPPAAWWSGRDDATFNISATMM